MARPKYEPYLQVREGHRRPPTSNRPVAREARPGCAILGELPCSASPRMTSPAWRGQNDDPTYRPKEAASRAEHFTVLSRMHSDQNASVSKGACSPLHLEHPARLGWCGQKDDPLAGRAGTPTSLSGRHSGRKVRPTKTHPTCEPSLPYFALSVQCSLAWPKDIDTAYTPRRAAASIAQSTHPVRRTLRPDCALSDEHSCRASPRMSSPV